MNANENHPERTVIPGETKSVYTPCEIRPASREVIERVLLTAIEDESLVAILATKQNLDDMATALECHHWDDTRKTRCLELAAGMRQMSREAFPTLGDSSVPPVVGEEKTLRKPEPC